MKFDVLPTATVDLIPVQICLHLATEMKADLNRDQVDRRRGKYVEFHPSFFSESTISTAVVLRNPPMG